MVAFTGTTVGRKYLMGVSGLIWAGFVFVHMCGNMLILISPQAYNAYGHAIVSNKPLLIASELILIFALATHIVSAIALTRQNRSAKGIAPVRAPNGAKSTGLASRTMAAQGALVLVFIISHLVVFKFGNYYETTVDGVVMRDLSKVIFEVFQSWQPVAWYAFCLVLLGFHLSHGFGSIFQSLGMLHPAYQPKIRIASLVYGFVVSVGFLSQPIYVFLSQS